MVQLKNLSVRDLPKRSVRLPIESNLCYKPEVQNCLKVIQDLKGKLNGCDKGISGLFTNQLQKLIGGEIYELNIHLKDRGYSCNVGHLFIYKDGCCYDCDGVCSINLLKSVRKIKRTYTESTKKYVPDKEHYFLLKCSKEEILKSYTQGDFINDFTPDEVYKLQKNTDRSQFKIKIRNVIGKVFKSF
ncbi:MAG: hypothetical protein ABSD71_13955 [Bacteroidales bacterium]|jgi:hypothetical protein